ncbi:MAG: protein-L-isoaspartate(D-aspartate) O-methyltransferase [Candidatus Accumulibacter sp.]|jgi:protein-L-isoaspartate(D-aspartate) O-methyltransferase|nr:protein-L-isoaspartate(D-aspartate) O-methyltransferase [Accumulibacter sp.]
MTRAAAPGAATAYANARATMVRRLREQGIHDEDVLAALAAVPRHLFVEEALVWRAYDDTALPLGSAQTISQPFVVARMIEILLDRRGGLGKTLEIGAGCGYQAAVLAQLTSEVYAVERIASLLALAKVNLRKAGSQSRVRFKYADGQLGLPEAAPFDTVIVAAAAPRVPPALLQQLALGGRMLLPLGAGEQRLTLIERRAEAYLETRLDGVRFVPLLSGLE